MRLTIRLLGLDLLDVEVTTTDDSNDDGPGDCTTQPIGFTAHMERPHEVETPDRDW